MSRLIPNSKKIHAPRGMANRNGLLITCVLLLNSFLISDKRREEKRDENFMFFDDAGEVHEAPGVLRVLPPLRDPLRFPDLQGEVR